MTKTVYTSVERACQANNGTVYFPHGYRVLRAIDCRSGKMTVQEIEYVQFPDETGPVLLRGYIRQGADTP
jgi:hypothetical protein